MEELLSKACTSFFTKWSNDVLYRREHDECSCTPHNCTLRTFFPYFVQGPHFVQREHSTTESNLLNVSHCLHYISSTQMLLECHTSPYILPLQLTSWVPQCRPIPWPPLIEHGILLCNKDKKPTELTICSRCLLPCKASQIWFNVAFSQSTMSTRIGSCWLRRFLIRTSLLLTPTGNLDFVLPGSRTKNWE